MTTEEALSDMIDLVIWMSGADAFGPGGVAEEGWKRGRERLWDAMEVLTENTQPRKGPKSMGVVVLGYETPT